MKAFKPAALAALLFLLTFSLPATAEASGGWVDLYNVVWESPSKDCLGSMPLGNGDVGINAWVEEDGDLLFYISKTDAYDDNGRLLKLGRMRVSLTPNPFAKGESFHQALLLREGCIEITARSATGSKTRVRLWVDANLPVIRLEVESDRRLEARAGLESWREQARPLGPKELTHSDALKDGFDGSKAGQEVIQYPDTVVESQANRIIWYHRNARSVWPVTMRLQGLEGLTGREVDPLLGRTFGGAVTGYNFVRESAVALKSPHARKSHLLAIHLLTLHPATADAWLTALTKNIARVNRFKIEAARKAHQQWWGEFWDRSWIRVDGAQHAAMSRGYALQRYLMACGARGNAWVKFNGSIFTLPWEQDPDFRRWDGAQWFQNARLPYWPLLGSGDYEMLLPFYQTYLDALPLALERTKLYYGHEGAFFPETLFFWGTYANMDYGWKREGLPTGFVTNPYVRYYWSGGLELSTLLLDHYAHTRDNAFLRNAVLPIASAVVRFYDLHWKRDAQHKIRFEPAQSLETWQKVVNPLPDIAGLRSVIGELLALPPGAASQSQQADWRRLLGELPPLPTTQTNGQTILAPAETILEEARNSENPELYGVFPYRLAGVGKPDLDLARATFEHRRNRHNVCWWQDDIQMACLGLARQAAENVSSRLTNSNPIFRFPAMWGPHNDEVPDMDHGGVGQMALQTMLLQADGKKLLLFPAWPKDWDVSFKLHAPYNTTVEGEYRGGRLVALRVTPQERMRDMVRLEPQ